MAREEPRPAPPSREAADEALIGYQLLSMTSHKDPGI